MRVWLSCGGLSSGPVVVVVTHGLRAHTVHCHVWDLSFHTPSSGLWWEGECQSEKEEEKRGTGCTGIMSASSLSSHICKKGNQP